MAKFYDGTSELTLNNQSNEYAQKVEANEMNPVKAVYLGLLNLGAKKVVDRNQKKYIRITNFVAGITFLGTLVYLTFAIVWDKWYWLYALLSLSVTCLGVFALNSFGRTTASRVTYILGFNLLIFLNTSILQVKGTCSSFANWAISLSLFSASDKVISESLKDSVNS